MSSSVAPGDFVSSAGSGKKNRPGKKERQARRGLSEATASNAPSSLTGAAVFAAGAPADPVPQPGRYPVVFPSGAGEPTRDSLFAYDGESIQDTVSELTDRYVQNSKYAEFAAHSGLNFGDLETLILRGIFLGLAQQTVHSHVNMGLPMGDFSPVATSDVVNFAAIRSIISQFGEFQSVSEGTRYLLAGYESTVAACVRAAKRADSDNPKRLAQTFWLPTRVDDQRTKYVVAHKLASYCIPFGVYLDVEELAHHVFSSSSDAWDAVKVLLGADAAAQNRFDFLFGTYNTEAAFLSLVTGSADRVDWLARVRNTLAKFFSLGSGLQNRAAASGSLGQMSRVVDMSGVSLVSSRLAVSRPGILTACVFPVLWSVFRPDPVSCGVNHFVKYGSTSYGVYTTRLAVISDTLNRVWAGL
ncbi:capsid protein [Fusarium solani virus 1]|uniref:Capsid protein n=1 Tax=Fusarium solani virus 1 TaxID=1511847 RepID=Q83329_9VIRU|nr:capsid protein [Fusarium solani virus 1]BAA09521.1 capsid protein [Fusarium solani virus 1]